jgi:hypothetical protein
MSVIRISLCWMNKNVMELVKSPYMHTVLYKRQRSSSAMSEVHNIFICLILLN